MSEITLAVQKEIGRLYNKKAVIVNGRGDLCVDGTILTNGPDGSRSFSVAQEGIERDVLELGSAGAVDLYRRMAKVPGRLGKTLQTAINLSRMLDADTVAGR
jgi:hypothetical protein